MKGEIRMGAALALLLGLPHAQASVTTHQLFGVVESVDASNGLLPASWLGIQIGDPFSVSYEFDDAFPDFLPDNPNIAEYRETIVSMTVTVGGQSFQLPLGTGGGVRDQLHGVANDALQNGSFIDQLTYTKVGCVAISPQPPQLATDCYRGVVFLRNASAVPSDILSSDGMIALPTMFASFVTRDFRFSAASFYTGLDSGSTVRDGFTGTLTGIAPAVPEPGTFMLMGLGLACLGLCRRLKASSARSMQPEGMPGACAG